MNRTTISAFFVLVFLLIFEASYAQKKLNQEQLMKIYSEAKVICDNVHRNVLEGMIFKKIADTSGLFYHCKELRSYGFFEKHKKSKEFIGFYILLFPQHHMSEAKMFFWVSGDYLFSIDKFNKTELDLILADVDKNKSCFDSKYVKKIRGFFK